MPLNVEYWASLYPVYTDYADEYEQAMEHSRLVDRVERLWGWKGLNRSIEFDEIVSFLKNLDQDEYIELTQEEAIRALSRELQDDDIVNSNSVVTGAFLLHLMASDPGEYSAKYPIYDRRVWNAYVYLWRIRGSGETLYSQASNSFSKYGSFCQRFKDACSGESARNHERALFMFGRFIESLSPNDNQTPIERIDETLESQENALIDEYDTSNYVLVDLDSVRSS